jgi:hypothetical protein
MAENKAVLLRLPEASLLAELPVGMQGGHVSLTFSADSRHLFIHNSDGAVQRWDLPAIDHELEKLGTIP